jgi:hypothetical protein
MCVSDCAESKRLLETATQARLGSRVREDFLDHVKHCSVCSGVGAADAWTHGTPSESSCTE